MHPLVEMTGITKHFGPVKALDQVDSTIYPGEVHILAGEDGAGKSTLMKILAGAYADYQGRIVMEDREVRPSTPLEANRCGIAAIHQELSLIPPMKVMDNLFLGHPVTRRGFIRERAHREGAEQTLRRVGLDVDVSTAVEDLPISVQQLIEITKAIRLEDRPEGVLVRGIRGRRLDRKAAIFEQILRERVGEPPEELHAERRAKIERELSRIGAIIGSLLSFSKVRKVPMKPLGVAALLADVALPVEHRLPAGEVRPPGWSRRTPGRGCPSASTSLNRTGGDPLLQRREHGHERPPADLPLLTSTGHEPGVGQALLVVDQLPAAVHPPHAPPRR